MAIEKTLALSTGHMKLNTNDNLSDLTVDEDQAFRYTGHEYGFIIFVPNHWEKDYLEAEGMEELLPILQYALNEGCTLINFDRDMDEMEEFETFDW